MTKLLMKSVLCLTAAVGLACAPAAFAGHGHYRGYGGHEYRGHGGRWDHDGRYYGGYGHRYYHRDHFGNWVAGAIVVGALTSLVVDATQPRTVYYSAPPPVVYSNPPVVYSRTRVIYQDPPPVERVYVDPYGTRYIRDDGYGDDDGD